VVRIRGMMRTQHFWIRTSLSSTAAALHATIGRRLPEWQTSKCISSVSFVWIESIFLQYTGDTDAKDDGPKFWNSNSVIFQNFLKFSKRHRTVPLRPIWTIMVVAKLDQSRVLVTNFVKIDQRWRVEVPIRDTQTDRQTDRNTHTQTNAGQNKGPTGLQSGQYHKDQFWWTLISAESSSVHLKATNLCFAVPYIMQQTVIVRMTTILPGKSGLAKYPSDLLLYCSRTKHLSNIMKVAQLFYLPGALMSLNQAL